MFKKSQDSPHTATFRKRPYRYPHHSSIPQDPNSQAPSLPRSRSPCPTSSKNPLTASAISPTPRLQRKMSRIHKRNPRIFQILPERPSTRRDKRRIPLPPDRQQRDLALSEVLVERRIQIEIRAVIVQQVQLHRLLLRRPDVLQVYAVGSMSGWSGAGTPASYWSLVPARVRYASARILRLVAVLCSQTAMMGSQKGWPKPST